MARTVVESLGIEFLFKGTQGVKQAKKAQSAVSGLMNGIGKLIGVSASLYVITGAISRLVQTAEGLYRSAQTSNAAVEELDAWGKAVEVAGGNAKAFVGSVQGFAEALVRAQHETGPMRSMLADLGVAIEEPNGKLRDTTAIMLDLAKALEGYSAPEKRAILKNLGFDESAITFMMKGREEMEKMIAEQKRLGVTSKETAERSGRIATSYRKVVRAWRTGVDFMLDKLLPTIETVATKLEEWSKWAVENKDVLEAIFAGVAAVITAVLLPALLSLAWAWLPVMLIIAAIAALGAALKLAYDDYMAWKNGGEAVFAGAWAVIDPYITKIKEGLTSLKDFIVGVWNDPKKAWEDAITYLKQKWEDVSSWFDTLTNRWKDKSLLEIGSDILLSLWSGIRSVWDNFLKPFLIKLNDDIKAKFGIDVYDLGSKALTSFWNGLKSAWSAMWTWLEGKYVEIVNFLTTFNFREKGKELGEKLKAWLSEGTSSVDWGSIAGTIFWGLLEALQSIGYGILAVFQFLGGVIEGLFSGVWKSIEEGWGKVKDWFIKKINEFIRMIPFLDIIGIGLIDEGGATAPPASAPEKPTREEYQETFKNKLAEIKKGADTLKNMDLGIVLPANQPTIFDSASKIVNNNMQQNNHINMEVKSNDPTAIAGGMVGAVKNGVSELHDAAAYNAESGIKQ